jgi:hypothetical protein
VMRDGYFEGPSRSLSAAYESRKCDRICKQGNLSSLGVLLLETPAAKEVDRIHPTEER